MFIFGLFWMNFALLANFKVPRVSSKFLKCGEHVTISEVLKFPPKLSYSRRVSFESLYGM